MTYSAVFRTQVIKSVKHQGISIRQTCAFYYISKATLQNWRKDSRIKLTRNKAPRKISNKALLKDVKQHPDNYMYQRTQRLGYIV